MSSVGAPRKAISIDRALAGWAGLAASLLFAAMAAPFLLGRYYTRDDLLAFHLPLRRFYADCLARGASFEWWPDVFCGYAAAAEGQAGMFHPLHLILYSYLPLDAAYSFELLISYPFMFFGTALFLTSQRLPRSAAFFGALVFTFSSFNLLHFVHPNAIAVMAHLPWLLFAIHRTFNVSLLNPHIFPRRRIAPWLSIVFLTASQTLLGYPQYVLYSLLVEAAFVCWLLAGSAGRVERTSNARSNFPPSDSAFCLLPSAFLRLSLAKLLGFGLGGIQLLPTLEALRLSSRAAPTADFALSGSLHPLNLIQLVAPYAFVTRVAGANTHEFSVYLGAVPLMLALWYFACYRGAALPNRLAAWSLALAVGAFALALGAYGPILPWLASLPGGALFRFPCRHTVLLQFAVAILAAIALATLIRDKSKTPPRRWPLFAVVALSLAATVWIASLSAPVSSENILLLAAGPALMLGAAILVTFAANGSRIALIGLVIFTALDLGGYGLTHSILNNSATASQIVSRLPLPPDEIPGRVIYDLDASPAAPHTGNASTLAGASRADGYAGLSPRRELRFDNVNSLRAASVRWVARSPESEAIAGLEPFNADWLRVPSPCPRAYLVSQTVRSDNPARDITTIDLATTALVPPSWPVHLARDSAADDAHSTGRLSPLLILHPSSFILSSSSATDQFLVLTESFHPDWQAKLDGQPATVVRANGDFLGVAVPSGDHTIQFEFQSRSVRQGARVSLLSAGLAFAFAALFYLFPWHGRPARDSHGQDAHATFSKSQT